MSTYVYAIALGTLYLLIRYIRKHRSPYASLPLPPGPKPLPLIGNLLDIPPSFPWEAYEKWFKEFQSDIIYVNATGSNVFVLNTYETAVDLLEKRSALYSSRVRLPMVNELMGWDFNMGLMQYGDRWRSHRRLFQQAFNASAVKSFESKEMKAARGLLLRFIDHHEPNNVMEHLRHMTGSVLLSVAYGIDVLPEEDPLLALAEKTVHILTAALVPLAFWVDFFPWLQYVPSWFPGAGFRRKAKKWSESAHAMLEKPYKIAKQKINDGDYNPSFISYSLEKLQSGHSMYSNERVIQNVAGVMYTAGSDTTLSALGTFVLAMIKHPEIQKKAQAELDLRLKGSLPTFEDQESLPYVTAIVKETIRWKAVTPFGVPHCLTSDDVYKGYRLPAGSMVVSNIWSMLHNEEIYPEPTTFNPDRFLKNGKLNPEIRDPSLIAFGFGRRICPGKYMALSSIWITVASILATMDITKALDHNGDSIEPSWEYESSLVHIPKPFKCSIKPRSEHAEALVRACVLNEE